MGGDLKNALKQDKDVTVFQLCPLWVMTLIEWWVMKCNLMCNYHELHDYPERTVAGIQWKLFAVTVASNEQILSPASVEL
eukprot:2011407-Rhodomonas_salina.1